MTQESEPRRYSPALGFFFEKLKASAAINNSSSFPWRLEPKDRAISRQAVYGTDFGTTHLESPVQHIAYLWGKKPIWTADWISGAQDSLGFTKEEATDLYLACEGLQGNERQKEIRQKLIEILELSV